MYVGRAMAPPYIWCVGNGVALVSSGVALVLSCVVPFRPIFFVSVFLVALASAGVAPLRPMLFVGRVRFLVVFVLAVPGGAFALPPLAVLSSCVCCPVFVYLVSLASAGVAPLLPLFIEFVDLVALALAGVAPLRPILVVSFALVVLASACVAPLRPILVLLLVRST